MKKNGFIATSLLYAFFLVFISLFIVLLLNFLHNRLLIQRIDENAREMLKEINNKKINQLEVGDYVQFINASTTSQENPFDDKGTWIVTSKNGNQVTLLSDLDVPRASVLFRVQMGSIKILKYNTMTIDLFNEMNGTKDNIDKPVGSRNSSIPSKLALKSSYYSSMQLDLVDSEYLKTLRNADIDNNIKRAIFNVKGSYVVRSNSAGYTTSYNYSSLDSGATPAYYEYRAYNFANYRNVNSNVVPMLSKYCGVSAFDKNAGTVTYNANNPYGYVAITEDSVKGNDGNIQHMKYVDFCYYASPVAYNNTTADILNDKVVSETRERPNGDLITSRVNSSLKLRFKMTLTVTDSAYIGGGKGIATDPYIINKGDKES